MNKLILITIAVILFSTAHGEEYRYHEMWSYKTRCGEEGSEILINDISETEKYGKVYHISVFNVKMTNGVSTGRVKILPHLAVSKKSLDSSLIKLTATRYPYPDFIKGYLKWKEALEKGTEVVNDAPIAEILESLEKLNCSN